MIRFYIELIIEKVLYVFDWIKYGATCNCGKNGENEEPRKQGSELTCHTGETL